MSRKTKDSGDFESRLQFSWGYQQARTDGVRRRLSHAYDSAYLAGYEAGLKVGIGSKTSKVAWWEWVRDERDNT